VGRLALHRAMVSRSTDAGYVAACRAIRDADLTGFAKAILVPTLCIGGRHPDPIETGMAVRRKVLSDAHVDKASANVTDLDRAFQNLITQAAWGTVWANPGIAPRERSMLTLALLAATGNFDEIPMHIRATARTGATARDISEAFQHVAIYAGVPKANHALKLAKQTLAEMRDD